MRRFVDGPWIGPRRLDDGPVRVGGFRIDGRSAGPVRRRRRRRRRRLEGPGESLQPRPRPLPAAGLDLVGDVVPAVAFGQGDTDLRRAARKLRGEIAHGLAAGIVRVGDQEHAAAGERLPVGLAPGRGPAGPGRDDDGRERGGHRVGAFLALDDQDLLAGGIGVEQLGQAVERARGGRHLPQPAVAVRRMRQEHLAPLARRHPADDEGERAGGVAVMVERLGGVGQSLDLAGRLVAGVAGACGGRPLVVGQRGEVVGAGHGRTPSIAASRAAASAWLDPVR